MESVKKHVPWYALGALIVSNILIWQTIFSESRTGMLTVAFLDVGQGDAIFIEAPNGNQMIIDGGPGNALARAIGEVLPFHDRYIDAIMVTHPDKDHFEGFIPFLGSYVIGAAIESGIEKDSEAYHTFQDALERHNVPRVTAKRGMRIVLDEAVQFVVLFPDRNMPLADSNVGSIVGQLIFGDTRFFFAGDAPAAIESYLLTLDKDILASAVLKVGHHGSRTATSETFVKAVNPHTAIISSGKDNAYGHPHQHVLDILESSGVSVLRTETKGTIVMQSDGKSIFTN